MKKHKISKQALVEMIVTKLNRLGKDGFPVTAYDIAKKSGWAHSYIPYLASTLRFRGFNIPLKLQKFDTYVEQTRKAHPELVKK